jgi:hypothetical protein
MAVELLEGSRVLLDAFNPLDGQYHKVTVTPAHIEITRKRGPGPAHELVELVPPTLFRPTAVFRGLRESGQDQRLCFVSSPRLAYDYETGLRVPPWPGGVFCVFVNEAKVLYTWRWEPSDPLDRTLPAGYLTRFTKRLELRNDLDPRAGRPRGT